MKNKYQLLISMLFEGLPNLIFGGIVGATGVCVMHYVGMSAVVFDGYIEWNVGIVIASVIIALIAATAAFWILFRLLSLFPHLEMLRLVVAIIMTVAVNGMHYTGKSFVHSFIHVYLPGCESN